MLKYITMIDSKQGERRGLEYAKPFLGLIVMYNPNHKGPSKGIKPLDMSVRGRIINYNSLVCTVEWETSITNLSGGSTNCATYFCAQQKELVMAYNATHLVLDELDKLEKKYEK